MMARAKKLKELNLPAFDVSKMRRRPEEKVMDPADWERFWPQVYDEKYRLYFDVLQSLGLRASEGLLLTPKDFDFQKGTVNVTPLKRGDGYSALFPVRPDIIDKMSTMTAPYFPFTYVSAWRAFKRIGRKSALHEKLGLHSLRHLCATRLILIQTSDFERMYFIRHKAKSMTDRYGYVPMARLRQISEEMWKAQTWIWKGDNND